MCVCVCVCALMRACVRARACNLSYFSIIIQDIDMCTSSILWVQKIVCQYTMTFIFFTFIRRSAKQYKFNESFETFHTLLELLLLDVMFKLRNIYKVKLVLKMGVSEYFV